MRELPDLKVLIADDHFLIRQFLRQSLKKLNILNIQTAENGSVAIDLILRARQASQPYDIVFLDWHMPGISGLDVLSYFRAKPEHGSTAFIMLTAECEQQSVMTAIKTGATSYIVKPVSEAEITNKLQEVYDWIRQR